jgi:flagellar biogenesis protein FliO
MEWLGSLFGGSSAGFTLFLVVVGLAAALVLLVWVFRKIAYGNDFPGSRKGHARLSVTDAAIVDDKRRLVLVRRDNVEHLILIGGPSDVVVEQNIVRHGAPSVHSEEMAQRRQRAPERQTERQPERMPEPVAELEEVQAEKPASGLSRFLRPRKRVSEYEQEAALAPVQPVPAPGPPRSREAAMAQPQRAEPVRVREPAAPQRASRPVEASAAAATAAVAATQMAPRAPAAGPFPMASDASFEAELENSIGLEAPHIDPGMAPEPVAETIAEAFDPGFDVEVPAEPVAAPQAADPRREIEDEMERLLSEITTPRR